MQEIKCNHNILLGLVVIIISHNDVNAEFLFLLNIDFTQNCLLPNIGKEVI